MEKCNKNNPTLGWTEDEQYDFCKLENKWLKAITRAKIRANSTSRKISYIFRHGGR